MFSGSMVALITPFQNGQVDYETLDELVEFHLNSGTDGIVLSALQASLPTLSHEEHKKWSRMGRQSRRRKNPRHRRIRLQQHCGSH